MVNKGGIDLSTAVDSVTDSSQAVKSIDHFSSLPNELLDEIFELTGSRPRLLSKRLVPWYLRGLYRTVYLGNDARTRRLIKNVNSNPGLGELVRHVSITHDYDKEGTEPIGEEELKRFFRHLVNVETLDLTDLEIEFYEVFIEMSSSRPAFPTLRQLYILDEELSTEVALQLYTSFPSITTLTHRGINSPLDQLDTADYPVLRNLTDLTFSGDCVDDPLIARICSLCPRLTSLSLSCRDSDYSRLLPLLPTNLTDLDLNVPIDGGVHCDSFLSRFTQLENLFIGSGLYSPNLPRHLSGLTHLKSISLGGGKVNVNRFLRLLSGPTRLPLLRHLRLDLLLSLRGGPLELKADGTVGLFHRDDTNWIVPNLDSEGGEFSLEKAVELVQVALREGVKITGAIVEDLQTYIAYVREYQAAVAPTQEGRSVDQFNSHLISLSVADSEEAVSGGRRVLDEEGERM
ncbi:hypothetical protein JCM3765_006249 [Sporobolomyces pararoseus]